MLTFENDLMTFLELDTKPSFPITEDFPWVDEALGQIQRMISENIVDPERLLQQYKKYEFVLNVSKGELKRELFENEELKTREVDPDPTGKHPLAVIKEKIDLFYQAEEDI